MQKKTITRIVLIAILSAAALMAFNSDNKVKNNTTCKDATGNCPKKRKTMPAQGDMIWENLPQQFFSVIMIPTDFQP